MTIAAQPLRPGDPSALGGYTLLGRLGEGGMGVVYLAGDHQGRHVAIKSIRDQYASEPQFLQRFRREAEAARRVPRFCTAAVLDADLDAAQPYLVTEFVDGPSLHAAIHKDGPLQGGDLDALAVGVAAALTAIHDAGLVHRDLKPGNVLLSRAGPRVIDFGIARAVDGTTHTLTGQVLGTPGYMAPEQVAGARVTPAADVFAWGGVVAFAASGNPPFGRDLNVPAALHRVLHGNPELGALEEGLRGIVAAAMDKEPSRRPAAADLLEELKAHADRAGDSRARVTSVLQQATEPAATRPAPVPLAPFVPGASPPEASPTGPPAGGTQGTADGTWNPAAGARGTAGGTWNPAAAAGTRGAEAHTAGGEPSTRGWTPAPAGSPTAPGALRPGQPAPGTVPGGPAVGRRGRLTRRVLASTAAAALVVAVGATVLFDGFGLRDPGGEQPTQTTVEAAQPAGEPAEVPDYVGQPFSEATAELDRANIAWRREGRESGAADLDRVVEMAPEPGEVVGPGEPITLYVGDGTQGDGTQGGTTQGGGTATDARDWLLFKRLDSLNQVTNNAPLVVVDRTEDSEQQIDFGDSPDIAPDGSRVAYVGGELAGEVITTRLDGGDRRQLTNLADGNRSATNLAWSRDGTAIAFFVNAGGGLHVVDAAGGGQRQVTDVNGFEMDWSPDGTQIVFRRPEAGDVQRLWVVGTDGSGLRPVEGIDLPDGVIPVQPAWSPDGDAILFGGSEGGIYLVDTNGTRFRQVAGANTWQPSWSPDGDVVFVRDDSGIKAFVGATGPIYTIDPDGTGERQLDGIRATGPVQWAREG